MKPLQIPPSYSCFVFACQTVLFCGTALKVVFASDLEHANSLINEWRQDQGIDDVFYYVSEVSKEDIHIYRSSYHPLSLFQ